MRAIHLRSLCTDRPEPAELIDHKARSWHFLRTAASWDADGPVL